MLTSLLLKKILSKSRDTSENFHGTVMWRGTQFEKHCIKACAIIKWRKFRTFLFLTFFRFFLYLFHQFQFGNGYLDPFAKIRLHMIFSSFDYFWSGFFVFLYYYFIMNHYTKFYENPLVFVDSTHFFKKAIFQNYPLWPWVVIEMIFRVCSAVFRSIFKVMLWKLLW